MRLFPSEEEKDLLKTMFEQFRWYYNATISIFYKHYGWNKILDKEKYSNYTIRDIVRKYEYKEDIVDDGRICIQDFVYDKNRNTPPIPPWWSKINQRLPRGASNKFTSSLNAAITNYKNKNNKNMFDMKYRTKKSPTDYLHFEDKDYPTFIKNIKSHYWYRTRDRKRKCISLTDITQQKRGVEIIYEKETDKYFLHYPVDVDWFPDDDKRNESQVKFTSKETRIISLDPGVRKFLVGYDPQGNSIFIGEGASIDLTNLLYTIDKTEDKKVKFLLWKKVKNLVEELHWKTISFLIENYDVILLPDFRVSQMIKSRKLARITKRLMCMFSFHSFKTKLKYKCKTYGKTLIIVDESYTSCNCGVCGMINKTGGKEVFKCSSCKLEIDRDVTGSRNILIKNITLR